MSREPERRVSSCQSLRSSATERGPEAGPGPGRWVSRWTGSGTTACRLAAEWWGIQMGLSETWKVRKWGQWAQTTRSRSFTLRTDDEVAAERDLV